MTKPTKNYGKSVKTKSLNLMLLPRSSTPGWSAMSTTAA